MPNTPRPASTSKAASSGGAKRKSEHRPAETPQMARVKLEMAGSPVEGSVNGSPAPPSFHDRPSAGSVVDVLNEQLAEAEAPAAPFSQSRIKLTANSDVKKLAYKPLAMKLSESSEILDDRIDEIMQLAQEHHKLDDSALGSAAHQNINEIVAVGRIACDSADGKLNTASVVLETSRRMGAGLRVPLRLDKLTGYQLFPGQIVALRGINVTGDEFTVSEILDLPLLPSAASLPSSLREHNQRLQGRPPDDPVAADSGAKSPLSVLVAAGPYTSDDNLDFLPLHALCARAADTYADCLVLAGPFLDLDHPLIAAGDIDLPAAASGVADTATLATLFRHLVTPALQTLCAANPAVSVLLVPSVRDALAPHVAWPQEAFPRAGLGLPRPVRLLGNPMTISLNELVLGISSQDVLSELRAQELVHGVGAGAGLLDRLPRYLVQQRHFFPLAPPSARASLARTGTADGIATGACVDVAFSKLGEMVGVRPDVLVVPSALPAFAKVSCAPRLCARADVLGRG
jgi:DNA polymerase alpha subunit B